MCEFTSKRRQRNHNINFGTVEAVVYVQVVINMKPHSTICPMTIWSAMCCLFVLNCRCIITLTTISFLEKITFWQSFRRAAFNLFLGHDRSTIHCQHSFFESLGGWPNGAIFKSACHVTENQRVSNYKYHIHHLTFRPFICIVGGWVIITILKHSLSEPF